MKIRFKLLLAAAAFLMIVLSVGGFSYYQQNNFGKFSHKQMEDLGALAADIYDKAFTGVDYAHKAEADFLHLRSLLDNPAKNADEKAKTKLLKSLQDNIDITIERAMTDKSREVAKTIKTKIAEINIAGNNSEASLDEIDKAMIRLVGRYADDAFEYRSNVDDLLEKGDKEFNSTQKKNVTILLIILAASVGFAAIISFVLERAITPPLNKAVSIANEISQGNLNNIIEASNGNGETEKLLKALSLMQSSIKENVVNIEQQGFILKQQAERDIERKKFIDETIRNFEMQVSSLLQQVSEAIAVITSSAEAIVSDADITNNNLKQTISETAETSANVSSIAAAAEELSVSVNDISEQVTKSAQFSQGAIQKTITTDITVKELSDSTERITQVVGLIGTITENINLLALNATIEAARAGEAGKGFSVVASEVKSLANQTAKSTDSISSQINEIRLVVANVIRELNTIRGDISEMGIISTRIAAAVEQQGVATQEIACNIQSTSDKVRNINTTINEVGEMSNSTSINSRKSLESVKLFSEKSQELNHTIKSFLQEIVE